MSIEQINELKSKLKGLNKEANDKFLCEYTYDAISLEGNNKIPYEGVENIILHNNQNGYDPHDVKEVLNHVNAYNYVLSIASQDNYVFTGETLKDLHEILGKDIFSGAGLYRNVNIQIIGGKHQPCDYLKVYDRMVKFYNELDTISPDDYILKAVFANARISKIHPFLDGNGRVSRLTMNYFLIKGGYLPVSIPISKKEAYIKNLETFKVEKDINPLVEFISSLLLERYKEVQNNK